MFSFLKKSKNNNAEMLKSCTAPFYALVITDTHGHATKEKLDEFLSDTNQLDVVFTLGDITHQDFETINNHAKLQAIPKYGLLGNHDYFSVLKDCGIESINGKLVEINGIRFVGMYGSIRYKSTTAPMFTDDESMQIANLLPNCDVFLTHDKAKTKTVDLSQPNFAHGGMLGIGEYIRKRKPAYHIHGHLHENMKEHILTTLSVGFCRYAYLKFDKSGIEIAKYFGPNFL